MRIGYDLGLPPVHVEPGAGTYPNSSLEEAHP